MANASRRPKPRNERSERRQQLEAAEDRKFTRRLRDAYENRASERIFTAHGKEKR